MVSKQHLGADGLQAVPGLPEGKGLPRSICKFTWEGKGRVRCKRKFTWEGEGLMRCIRKFTWEGKGLVRFIRKFTRPDLTRDLA